ncbi:carbon-monoxide dehydrogenase medium subunit [Antricoccus suffuscus]|uniref:Carbon-monoxide dehydrogenase medium subunit n=1 Tax=Antricoccus suffuscus TaxID=1629062 RepID=A0A2T1A6X6_9ACTN|nr:FAD binding domain-containing protein [Antricoccus suffuscus]PRZ44351.1 carbon-monoxide dehydrogenase medium subunit [Antricoccus suffuscus]
MKPPKFDYVRAASVAEAVAVLDANEDSKILAGGQSFVPVLALRMAQPSVVVDINRIDGLSGLEQLADGTTRVGALVRHYQLVEQRQHPLLASGARWIGHTAIRSRGTCAGSIAHADSSAELPVLATALDATVHITGPASTRTLAVEQLFQGAMTTALEENEMITAVDFKIAERWGFAEFARRHGDFAIVLAAAAEVDGELRVVLGGVGGVPERAFAAEQEYGAGGPAAIDRAAAAAADQINPTADLHGSVEFRRDITREMVRRALTQFSTAKAS